MPNTIRDLYGHSAHKGKDVGIEIEMEGSNISITAPGWEVHSDGSLRPNPEAIEWVTNGPYPHKDVANLLSTLQDTLKANKAKLNPSDRCGVHVHVNCQQLTVSQVLCFLCAYLILEDPLVAWCGEDRVGNLFSLRAKDAEGFVQMLLTSAQNENFNNFEESYRYSAVNVASLLKFGSLEFRSLRTPKDFSVINTWVNMLMRIKHFSLGFKHPREIIEMVSAQGFIKFPQIVLGDMAELIQCKGIGMMVCEGVRRVQDIAYVDLIYKKKAKPQEEAVSQQPLGEPQQWHQWRTIATSGTTTSIFEEASPAPNPGRVVGSFEFLTPPTNLTPIPTPPRRTRRVIADEMRVIESEHARVIGIDPARARQLSDLYSRLLSERSYAES